jgi:curved DNA-binding protein
MEFKDYYAALGVSPNASDQEIKQAYRTLARQHHPDVNPGDKAAEDRFKEVNEAYQALGDAERRRKYDEMRQQYEAYQRGGGPRGFDWGAWQSTPNDQREYRTVSPDDLEDLFGAESPYSDFFSSIFGQARGDSTRTREARPRRGRDIEAPVELTLEEAFHGASRALQIGDRRIEARIPPGADTGARVRLAGQGAPGSGGGPPGDVYLVIEVLPHERFERDGDDLTTDADVDIFTAAVGGEARVQTLDGKIVLKIPPRTQAGKVFRLRGKGMPHRGQPGQRGDLYVRARLVLPEPLSDEDLATLRQLKQARQAVTS